MFVCFTLVSSVIYLIYSNQLVLLWSYLLSMPKEPRKVAAPGIFAVSFDTVNAALIMLMNKFHLSCLSLWQMWWNKESRILKDKNLINKSSEVF